MFSAGVVSDLCVAIGEYIDEDPKGAATVAKKLGAVLLAAQERSDENTERHVEEAKLREGRQHELQQRQLDVEQAQLELEGERVKMEAAAIAAGGRR